MLGLTKEDVGRFWAASPYEPLSNSNDADAEVVTEFLLEHTLRERPKPGDAIKILARTFPEHFYTPLLPLIERLGRTRRVHLLTSRISSYLAPSLEGVLDRQVRPSVADCRLNFIVITPSSCRYTEWQPESPGNRRIYFGRSYLKNSTMAKFLSRMFDDILETVERPWIPDARGPTKVVDRQR